MFQSQQSVIIGIKNGQESQIPEILLEIQGLGLRFMALTLLRTNVLEIEYNQLGSCFAKRNKDFRFGKG